ncbi:MAG: 8-oxo-dGTP diphosphatase [Clostridiales bacterium]|nr:8-oxo-dGTP diphosphatase [Clostridiales bacterium]
MYNSTLCYLENDRGEYLMLHRVKKKVDINKDKWIGVGGKFEDGESPDECLRREVREETGLTLTDFQFRGVVTFLCSDSSSDQFMYLFTATGWTGELDPDCSEGDLAWVPKEKVLDLPIWEGDAIFLRLLAEDAPPFLLTLDYRDESDKLVRAVLNGTALPVSN